MRRLPLNLASEPVESVRRARRITGVTLAVLAAVTLLHTGAILWLQRDAASAREQAEAQIVSEVELMLWQEEVGELEQVADVIRAREAATAVASGNQLIAWRVIPWPAIFADLEAILPDRVRLESVQPAIDTFGQVQISMQAVARDTGPLQDLLIRLEEHHHFGNVFPQREEFGTDGLARLTLVAAYEPARPGNGIEDGASPAQESSGDGLIGEPDTVPGDRGENEQPEDSVLRPRSGESQR
jgi:Tfp pilus assembly protein PilN